MRAGGGREVWRGWKLGVGRGEEKKGEERRKRGRGGEEGSGYYIHISWADEL